MLYDTSRKDLLPHIMAGRSARSRAWIFVFSALFGGSKTHNHGAPQGGGALHA